MNKKFLVVPAIVALSLCACSKGSQTANQNEVQEDIMKFNPTEETDYTLYLPEQGYINITPYVVDGTDRNIKVSISFAEAILGYSRINRTEQGAEPAFIELQNENANLLQFEIGGKNIVHDGKIFACAEEMQGDQNDLTYNLNDVLFAIGYQKMDQSVSGNNLITIVYRDVMDDSIMLPVDENGSVIDDVDLLVNYTATPSNAEVSAENETEIAEETIEETEETQLIDETVVESAEANDILVEETIAAEEAPASEEVTDAQE